jgi:uncharacterized membrane protein YagU involved in acid resistance
MMPLSSKWILLVSSGGLIAGTLDICYACVFWGLKTHVPPSQIFQSVAAGLLGRASFSGGGKTAALGLALHFLIAMTMSFAYCLMAQYWLPLRQKPWVWGAAYGLALYVFMNYIVVPLSAAGPSSKDPLWIVLSIVVHALLVGIPISLCTRAAFP